MKRRKNKVVVEITTSSPLTEKEAVLALRLLFDERLDHQAKPIWAVGDIYCDKLTVKEFGRTARAAIFGGES